MSVSSHNSAYEWRIIVVFKTQTTFYNNTSLVADLRSELLSHLDFLADEDVLPTVFGDLVLMANQQWLGKEKQVQIVQTVRSLARRFNVDIQILNFMRPTKSQPRSPDR